MNEAQFRSCYQGLKQIHEGLECYEVVRAVEEYRQYWRPKTVKVVLLAESHVFTTEQDFSIRLKACDFLPQDYPDRFVRFVYCLGYGERDLLDRKDAPHKGTPDFWKNFLSCRTQIKEKTYFAPILKTKTPDLDQRLRNKCKTLQDLKKRGIWLVDASITGLYISGQQKLPPQTCNKVIEHCWDNYVGELLAEVRPRFVICVGKGVGKALRSRLDSEYGTKLEIVRQPARLPACEYRKYFKLYFDICKQYAP